MRRFNLMLVVALGMTLAFASAGTAATSVGHTFAPGHASGGDEAAPTMLPVLDKTQWTRSTLSLTLFCNELCSVKVTGELAAEKGSKPIKLRSANLEVPADAQKTFTIKLGRKAASSLKKRKKVKASLRFEGSDAAGNLTVKSTAVTLKYKKPK
jgi:hypothetical protein